ncbi:MAG: SET domain-containing protein-lysine N-methyltransferase [Gammaproteobacteria bacterium]|nr:SET domain-containing protein-lysine N-methyltransferase [Gammaproteobacteria bacterium]MCH9764010.1 SET domain-containing protein-lysine N-methyltransferase [Gammaproteobacteria bacterium]
MVKINLKNHQDNASYPYQHITFDVSTGLSELEDGQHITKDQLLAKLFFSNPLLDEPYTPISGYHFKYTYNNLTELLYTATFICTVLIHTDNAHACQFSISPSANFQKTECLNTLHLSINYRKTAKSRIPIDQLNKLINDLSGNPFQFSNDTLPNYTTTIDELPDVIDGDMLFSAPSPQLLPLLHTPNQPNTYELRYIHPMVGFGVFSRVDIKEGFLLGFYTGTQTHIREENQSYSFSVKNEPLPTYVHALYSGNLTRFINHAPTTTKTRFLSANIKADIHHLHGVPFITYKAKRDILTGEQLLVDYGPNFFNKRSCILFKANGRLRYGWKLRRFSPSNKILLGIMANHHIRAAQVYRLKRLLLISGFIGLAVTLLHLT